MKKWIALVIIVLILIINPSKSNTFNKKSLEGNNIKELNDLEISGEFKYTKYEDSVIVGTGQELVSINSLGESSEVLKLSKDIENFELGSNKYIDIIDKKDKKITSIDGKGKTVFTDKINQEILMYKSIKENLFLSAYIKEDKQYVRIQDEEKSIVNEIEYSSKLTHIDSIKDNLLVVDLKTDEGLYSEIKSYDLNGALKQSSKFDEIVIDIICDDNNIYLAFENKIMVLDEELKEKSNISINGIESIEKDDKGQIYVVNKEKQITCISGESKKNIKGKSEIIGIEPVGEEYVIYSNSSIYNKDNKEILDFKEDIKDIIYISDDVIIVNIDKSIKIYKLS